MAKRKVIECEEDVDSILHKIREKVEVVSQEEAWVVWLACGVWQHEAIFGTRKAAINYAKEELEEDVDGVVVTHVLLPAITKETKYTTKKEIE